MADARYVRMIMLGEYTTGVFEGEIWSTGLSMVQGDGGGDWPGSIQAPLPTFSAAVIGESETVSPYQIDWAWKGDSWFTREQQKALADACGVFWNAVKAYHPASGKFTSVAINAYDATGHVIGGANRFDLLSPVAGGKTETGILPAQMAVAATLRTGRRGPGGRGRMYLPLNGITLASGEISAASRTTVADAVKALLENVWNVGFVPSVVNRAALTHSSIDRVDVGNLMDIQRRRSNAISEAYTGATPVFPGA